MNTNHWFKLLLQAVAVLAVGLTMARAQDETPVPSTVMRLQGTARVSMNGGRSWKLIKAGDVLNSGCMIQTAKKSDLDILLGEAAKPPAKGEFFNPETHPAHFLSLSEDTLLTIDKLTRKGAVEEISLNLRSGVVSGNVRKLTGESKYEIAFVSGVAGMREAIYKLRSSGQMSVQKGRAFIALTDGSPAQEVASGNEFNPGKQPVVPTPVAPPIAPPAATPPPAETPKAPPQSERKRTAAPLLPPPGSSLRRARPYGTP